MRRTRHQQRRWYLDLRATLQEHGGNCRLCGLWYLHSSVDPDGLRLAHLAPFSATNTPTNQHSCTLACRMCDNRMKTDDWTGHVPSLADEPATDWQPATPLLPPKTPKRRSRWRWTGAQWSQRRA